MDRFPVRILVIALLLAAVTAPAPATAAPPSAPGFSHGVAAALVSPGAPLARLWAWVGAFLPGSGHDRVPAAARPGGGSSGPGVRPDDGSALDPNG
jgi:hypothetical protein